MGFSPIRPTLPKAKGRRVDLIDCSSGALVPYAKIPAGLGSRSPLRLPFERSWYADRRCRAYHANRFRRNGLSPRGRPMSYCWRGRCCASHTGLCRRHTYCAPIYSGQTNTNAPNLISSLPPVLTDPDNKLSGPLWSIQSCQEKEEKMEYDFLVDTYETERLKTLSVWSTFRDDDLPIRPHPLTKRQKCSRNTWCTSV